MQKIIKLLVLISMSFIVSQVQAQENSENKNSNQIEFLKKQKKRIQEEERDFLKLEVEAINLRVDRGEISKEEAENLKTVAAQNRALNIDNRIAIVNNKIELLERNSNDEISNDDDDLGFTIRVGNGDEEDNFIFIGNKRNKPRQFDRRTTSDLVIAFGLTNAIVEGESLEDSPYKIGGSRFFEIGWAWKTRVFNNSNFLRFKYGYSFMINGLKPNDNNYFVKDGNQTILEEFPYDLRKSKLTISNLVFPVHFEFGPSKKIERKTYFRYSTRGQFKMGIGGYAGFNIGTFQKLKYSMEGDNTKNKIKSRYNTSSFVYGISSYVAFDDVALYIKYELSPIFKNQTIDQNNISIGLRLDVD